MNQSHYIPARDPGPDGYSVDISPSSAKWNYSSMRVLNLKPNEKVTWRTGESEGILRHWVGAQGFARDGGGLRM